MRGRAGLAVVSVKAGRAQGGFSAAPRGVAPTLCHSLRFPPAASELCAWG